MGADVRRLRTRRRATCRSRRRPPFSTAELKSGEGGPMRTADCRSLRLHRDVIAPAASALAAQARDARQSGDTDERAQAVVVAAISASP